VCVNAFADEPFGVNSALAAAADDIGEPDRQSANKLAQENER